MRDFSGLEMDIGWRALDLAAVFGGSAGLMELRQRSSTRKNCFL